MASVCSANESLECYSYTHLWYLNPIKFPSLFLVTSILLLFTPFWVFFLCESILQHHNFSYLYAVLIPHIQVQSRQKSQDGICPDAMEAVSFFYVCVAHTVHLKMEQSFDCTDITLIFLTHACTLLPTGGTLPPMHFFQNGTSS